MTDKNRNCVKAKVFKLVAKKKSTSNAKVVLTGNKFTMDMLKEEKKKLWKEKMASKG